MQPSRVLVLKENNYAGESILYVMSRDQRLADNHALLAAQARALTDKVPLVICFNLLTGTGVRRFEHFNFMLQGLKEVAADAARLNIPFVMTYGKATDQITKLAHDLSAGAVYFDFSPLRGPRSVAKTVAAKIDGSSYVVDTHNVIPVWVTSQKQEFAARTIRPKVRQHLEQYLVEPDKLQKHPYTLDSVSAGITFKQAYAYINTIPRSGIHVDALSGAKAAHKHLQTFIESRLENYAIARNDISHDQQSGLSPYLHFGQISSLRVALEVLYTTNQRPLLFDQAKMAQAGGTPSKLDGLNALFEEMIVRKELSDNFCLYSPSYDTLDGAPEWAKTTLLEHAADPREFVYSRQELESAKTHDPAWNAAQNQLLQTGKIHGYMRMYWAKKVLEWTKDPATAVADAIYLNDAYSIDGGDPNGYVGVLWSIAGLHDRPWTKRPVFGTIRYMNETGLKRKFDLQQYIDTWNK